MASARVLHWNGRDVPAELRDLPAGAYVVERIDAAPGLTRDEEQGLVDALAAVRADEGRPLDEVRQVLRARLNP